MEQPQAHPAFADDYDRFWRRYRSRDAEAQEIATILRLAALEPGHRVLDLACGFGRISNQLAGHGLRVVGVDSSTHLLEVARAEAPAGAAYHHGDMRYPPVPAASFDAVLVWSTSLGYYDEADDETTLAAARAALRDGGTLLVESRHWDAFGRTFDERTQKWDGEDLLEEQHRYDPLTGRQLTAQVLVVDGRRSHRSYHVRRYGAPELRTMLLRAGFREVTAHDERGEPLQPTSKRAVLRARA